MEPKLKFGFAVEYVSDVDEAKHFYADVLGLKVERTSPEFIQFDGFAIAGDAPVVAGHERELYWITDDAERAYAELSRQAQVTLPLKEMPFGKIFGVQGPAGHPCYVVQFARERPSQKA